MGSAGKLGGKREREEAIGLDPATQKMPGPVAVTMLLEGEAITASFAACAFLGYSLPVAHGACRWAQN